MLYNELNADESALIEILRNFDFLIQEGYRIEEINYGTRESPSLVFANKKNNRYVAILGNDVGTHNIIIEKRGLFHSKESSTIDISDCYQFFTTSMIKHKNYTLKTYASFIKDHLMAIIKGDAWINDLINK